MKASLSLERSKCHDHVSYFTVSRPPLSMFKSNQIVFVGRPGVGRPYSEMLTYKPLTNNALKISVK